MIIAAVTLLLHSPYFVVTIHSFRSNHVPSVSTRTYRTTILGRSNRSIVPIISGHTTTFQIGWRYQSTFLTAEAAKPSSSMTTSAAEHLNNSTTAYNTDVYMNCSNNGLDSATLVVPTTTTTTTTTTKVVHQNTVPTSTTILVLQRYIKEKIFMGIPITSELLAIILIYFVEGALGIARLAQSYLLKDTLQLGPAELSALSGLFVLPWTIKPLYGLLSDGIPLWGYKRKSYLIACGTIGTIAYGILSYENVWNQLSLAQSTSGTVVALMIGSACIAFSDVVADGIVVTRTREIAIQQQQQQTKNDKLLQQDTNGDDTATASATTAGGLQSLCWGASAIGGLLSAYFSGSLLEVMSVRSIFGITAILPLLVAIIATGMDEERVDTAAIEKQGIGSTSDSFMDGIRDQLSILWGAFQQSSIWKPTLFVFLWQSTPTSDGAFFYFLTNDLHLGPEFLGRVRFITAGAGLLGVFLYNQYFKLIQIKTVLFWSTLLSFPLGLLPVLLITHANRELGIPDTWLIYGDDVALAVLGTIAFMPTLVLAARLCPPGIEAVLFATLMSIYNGASTVGTELGALLTKVAGITESNFDNLAMLTTVCNISSLWPLIFIGWLDEVAPVPINDDSD
jgi:BT1 family